jgi:hypothetical protein
VPGAGDAPDAIQRVAGVSVPAQCYRGAYQQCADFCPRPRSRSCGGAAFSSADAGHALQLQRSRAGALGAAVEWLTAVVSETAKRVFTSPEHAATWFEAERPTSIAIVMSAARRPDYRDMTLTFAIALGKVLKSQRRWLKDFHDVAAVGASTVPHVQSRSGSPRPAMVPACCAERVTRHACRGPRTCVCLP